MNNQIFQYNGNPITFQIGEATMVNATQMAKPFKGSKRPQFFLNQQSTDDFLTELSKARKIALTDLVIVSKGGSNPGTWLHEDVALEFARWLSPQFAIWCNDRIKELMKYGMTATPQTIDNILSDPDNAIKILTALKEERKRVALLEDQKKAYQSENQRLLQIKHDQELIIELQAPKASYTDTVLLSSSTYTTTQIAKDMGMTGRMLNSQLKAMGVQYFQSGQWLLYKRHQDKGYTKTHTHHFYKNNGSVGTNIQTVWTEKGRMFIYSIIKVDSEYLTELGKEISK